MKSETSKKKAFQNMTRKIHEYFYPLQERQQLFFHSVLTARILFLKKMTCDDDQGHVIMAADKSFYSKHNNEIDAGVCLLCLLCQS